MVRGSGSQVMLMTGEKQPGCREGTSPKEGLHLPMEDRIMNNPRVLLLPT